MLVSFPIGSVVEDVAYDIVEAVRSAASVPEVVYSGFASLEVVAEAVAPDVAALVAVFPCTVSRNVAAEADAVLLKHFSGCPSLYPLQSAQNRTGSKLTHPQLFHECLQWPCQAFLLTFLGWPPYRPHVFLDYLVTLFDGRLYYSS
jgi:hypothetical protein